MSRAYVTAIRRKAGKMSDAELRRELGMSNHELIRVRALPIEEQIDVIADLVMDRVFRILR